MTTSKSTRPRDINEDGPPPEILEGIDSSSIVPGDDSTVEDNLTWIETGPESDVWALVVSPSRGDGDHALKTLLFPQRVDDLRTRRYTARGGDTVYLFRWPNDGRHVPTGVVGPGLGVQGIDGRVPDGRSFYENAALADGVVDADWLLDRIDRAMKFDRLRAYCEAGRRLLPLWEIGPNGTCACPKGEACGRAAGKHPLVDLVPHGVTDATGDVDFVRKWHEDRPTANWGWALDPRHIVVDIDPRNGFTLEELDRWPEIFLFDLPPTLTQETGGGGRHLVFELPEGVTIQGGGIRLPPPGSRRVQGIDVKKSGGYILIEPSNHASGNPYQWVGAERVAQAPDGLLNLLLPRATTAGGAETWEGQREWPPQRLAQWYAGEVPPGRQRTELMSFIGLKRRHGIPVDLIVAEAWAGVQRFELGRDERGGVREPWTYEEVERAVRDRCASIPAGPSGPSDELTDWARNLAQRDEKLGEKIESSENAKESFIQFGPQVRQRPPLVWLVADILPERALFQIFGQTGTFKTFVVIELLGQVANAGEFLGHKVNVDGPGLVAMVLGEGGGDIGERVTAWTVAHDADGYGDENMAFIIDQDLDLLDVVDVNRLGENLMRVAKERGLPWRIIAFDTQADHLPNAPERDEATFSRLKPVLLHIARQTGAAVGLVHHTGWDDTRERGSSRQRQMMDVQMEISDHVITAKKVKAGRLFAPIRFAVRETVNSLSVYVPEVTEVLSEEARATLRDAQRVYELLQRLGATAESPVTITAITDALSWGRGRVRAAATADDRIEIRGGGGRGRPTDLWIADT